MGCQCQVLVLGGQADLANAGEARVRELENRWTRFDPNSELSRFNSRAGHMTLVSPDLSTLLWRGLAGYRLSNGLFNPFMGAQIRDIGYDRDFDDLNKDGANEVSSRIHSNTDPASVGPQPLRFRRQRRLAWLAPGLEFDSGGIGKGLGAQIVVSDLLRSGAGGAMVSLGGDVAVGGSWPDEGWRIGIDDPAGRDDQPMNVVLRDGVICTSSVLKRRWVTEDGDVSHHILDPATGRSLSDRDVVAASAIARQGWRAEVFTKMSLVGGSQVARDIVRRNAGVALLIWDRQGSVITIQ